MPTVNKNNKNTHNRSTHKALLIFDLNAVYKMDLCPFRGYFFFKQEDNRPFK